MKKVIVELTLAEAEALLRVAGNTMERPAVVNVLFAADLVAKRAAYRATNKLQDRIACRIESQS